MDKYGAPEFKLKFRTNNIAFEDDQLKPQVAYILTVLAAHLVDGTINEYEGIIQDINGNTIGEWSMDAEGQADAE